MSTGDRISTGAASLAGVGPDSPIAINEKGAAQSALPFRIDLLPGESILRAAQVFAYGAERYARNNWRGITMADHLNHALVHAFAYMAGDRSDDHLGHFLARALMLVACEDPNYDFQAYEALGVRAALDEAIEQIEERESAPPVEIEPLPHTPFACQYCHAILHLDECDHACESPLGPFAISNVQTLEDGSGYVVVYTGQNFDTTQFVQTRASG